MQAAIRALSILHYTLLANIEGRPHEEVKKTSKIDHEIPLVEQPFT